MIRGMLFLHLNQNCGEYDETFVEWAMFRVLLCVVLSYVGQTAVFGLDNNEAKCRRAGILNLGHTGYNRHLIRDNRVTCSA